MSKPGVIARLIAKLDRLAETDAQRTIFGANDHDYARVPVSPEALALLEADLGAALPGDYRQWLLRVGSGAGPHYGLWDPPRIVAEFEQRRDVMGIGGDVDDPARISSLDVSRQLDRIRRGDPPGDTAIRTNGFGGSIPISHQGDNGYSFLFLAGAFAGCVFGECCDCIDAPWTAAAAFWPEGFGAPATRRPSTFLVWMEAWLDVSLAGLEIGQGSHDGDTSRR